MLHQHVKQELSGLLDLQGHLGPLPHPIQLQQNQQLQLPQQQQHLLQHQHPLDRFSDNDILIMLGSKLQQLKLSAFQVETWFLIQRRRFDARVLDEPYHAIQLLVNFQSGQFLHRVWGRTKDKGFLNSLSDLEQICWRIFHRTVPCAGFHHPSDLKGRSGQYLLTLEYPFQRRISRNCALTYQLPAENASIDELHGTGLCSMCVTVPKGDAVMEDEPLKEERNSRVDDVDETSSSFFLAMGTDDAKEGESVREVGRGVHLPSEPTEPYKDTKRRLKAYIKVGGKKIFQCHHEECEKVYYNGRSLLIHLKNFHLFGPFECLACQTFDCQYAQDLYEHIKINHADIPFKCPICAETTFVENQREEFRNHYLECWRLKRREAQPKQKPKEKKHQCELCGKTFPKERLLNEHRNWHKGVKPLKCNECDFATCYLSSLYSHNQKHLREKGVELTASSVRLVFKCDQCDKSFGRPNILRQHKKIIHDGIKEMKTCEHCGLTFPNKSQWRRHTLKEHSKAPRFPCSICKTNCIDRYELNIHMRVHNDPEFICRFCGKAVKSKQSLMAHERSHTGENPFRCDLCDYTCKASSVLCKHKVLKHKQQPVGWDKNLQQLMPHQDIMQ